MAEDKDEITIERVGKYAAAGVGTVGLLIGYVIGHAVGGASVARGLHNGIHQANDELWKWANK